MPKKFEVGIVQEGYNDSTTPSEEIIQADNFVPSLQKPFTKMASKKARTTSDQNPHALLVKLGDF